MNNKLLELREKNELYQKDIAQILNVDQRSYSTWEIGTRIIPLKHLNTLCNYYDVNADYILGLTNKIEKVKKLNLDKNKIGQNIKIIRTDNNLTLKDLAKELNTTSSTISAYETGKTLILTVFTYQIAKKYNISLDWLLGKKDTKKVK